MKGNMKTKTKYVDLLETEEARTRQRAAIEKVMVLLHNETESFAEAQVVLNAAKARLHSELWSTMNRMLTDVEANSGVCAVCAQYVDARNPENDFCLICDFEASEDARKIPEGENE
jgi:hypothetical protein